MSIDNFKKDIELAVNVLKNNTDYILNRELIDKLFENNSHSFENICLRLTVIDAFYSTNMSKRLYGIRDLAKAIYDIGNDIQIKEQVQKYKSSAEKNEIKALFDGSYGINKMGNPSGKARSLISKYLYFVTNHDFPIEDSLVKEDLNNILAYYGFSKKRKDNDLLLFLISFCRINEIAIGDLDNFLWLIGKINKGSLSLIVKKEDYQIIIKKLDIQKANSTDISNRLRSNDYINKISDIISPNLRELLYLNKTIYTKCNPTK